ncbi:MarR family winged helix-turn-helix transcriptional regulator [Nocardia sp. NPDC052278]|uniref:MarR family winged helix-turn-helix transcriptional regulator n=1 Tax=unclassified Nocardia TaxID=2637762 RepID=UPI003676B6F6
MTDRRPTSEELVVLSRVPLISASFQRAHNDMPEPLRETYEEHRLGPRHGAVLVQLLVGEPASVSDLAGRLHLSLSTTSELVGDLSRADLVERREDPANRRRTLVSFADGIRPIFEDFIAARSAGLLAAMSALSPRDRQGFLAGIVEWAEQEEAAGAAPRRRRAPRRSSTA